MRNKKAAAMLAVGMAMALTPESFTPRGPRERDNRTDDDIDERAAKQAAKLARRAARHKREAAQAAKGRK